MRGVIYARYSSDNQREESIEGQIRENTAYANKNGINIVGTYIDRAYSAKTDNRPEFQRMIKDSAKKNFDVVIVWKLDRFSRNRYDSARYKTMLRKNGVKVVSATESISDGAEGIILESVLERIVISFCVNGNYFSVNDGNALDFTERKLSHFFIAITHDKLCARKAAHEVLYLLCQRGRRMNRCHYFFFNVFVNNKLVFHFI